MLLKEVKVLLRQSVLLFMLLVGFVSVSKGQDFTIGTIPDIQNLPSSDAGATLLNQEMQFYVDRLSTLNVKFIASLGDNVDYTTTQAPPAEWQRAKNAFNILKNAGIPYSPCAGNNDLDYLPCKDKQELGLTSFNTYFPLGEFSSTPSFGGYFRNMSNAYYLFSASGLDFIVIVIQTHDPNAYYDQTSISWANGILDQYSSRRAIFITHDFYDNKGLIADVVKKHDNIFLAICGHTCAREAQWTETFPSGKVANIIVTDYQCDADKGATTRYYTFKPSENKIYAYTYNAKNKAYETDANSQFSLDFDMNINLPTIALTQASAINEGAENGKTITVTLAKGVFAGALTKSNWSALNLPTGVTIGSVTRNSDTQATITLSGNSTIGTYTSNITNVSITAAKAEIVSGANNVTASSGITLTKAPFAIPGKIEAENYSAMSLVQLEPCTDTGNGQDVSYIDATDWMSYSVNVATAGDYTLDLRVASLSVAGKVEIQLDGITKKTIDLPITLAWQKWQTATESVNLTAGVHALKINVLTGGFNLNWLTFTSTIPVTSPVISNISNTPTIPTSADAVTVSATITDDKSVVSAKLFWGTTSTTLTNQVTLTASGSSYSGTIPTQADGSTIYYKVTATDGDLNTSTSVVSSYIVSDKTSVNYADYDGVDLLLTGFDGENFLKIANPVKGGINTSNNVGQVIKDNASKTWAGVKTDALSAKLDFSVNTIFKVKVYSPKACTVLLKLEDAANAAVNKEVSVVTTKVNQWEELSYNFAGTAANTYSRIILFFDFGTTVAGTYYFDDLKQVKDVTTELMSSLISGNQFVVYPNPSAAGYVNVEFAASQLTGSPIQIYDLQGRLLLNELNLQNDKLVQVNIESLNSGLYVIKVAGEVQKLILN